MEAGIRADLDSSCLSTLPKRDPHRAVLQFVNSLCFFSRVHVAEGKAYMASWDAKDTFVDHVPPEARNPQSCGFATPVLKPRVAPAQKDMYLARDETQKRITQSPKNSGPLSNLSSQVGAKFPKKAASKTSSKEAPPRRERRSVKRSRERQSDEEKRLQERREKKRTRRDIMRPGALKKQAEDDDQSQDKQKVEKSRKLRTGLALMYGFAATNVGKNRLTIEPSFRSGVFGKGKASTQVRISKSKSKGISFSGFRSLLPLTTPEGTNLAFSEKEFLRSAITRKRRHGKVDSSAASGPRSSHTSSEYTDDQCLSRQRSKERTSRSIGSDSVAPLAQKQQKIKIPQVKVTKDRTERRSLRSPSEKAQSIVWDIERDDGVLPIEASPILTQGSKASTVLLDIGQNRWLPDFALNKKGVSGVQGSSIQQENIIDDVVQHSVVGKEQDSSSSISSVRPSESPSQVASGPGFSSKPQEETVSKYFIPILSQVRPHGEPTYEVHTVPKVPFPPTGDESLETGPTDLDDKGEPLQIVKEPKESVVAPAPQDVAPNVQAPRDVINDSDWLLSDPILSPVPDKDRNCGTEIFRFEGLEDIQFGFDSDSVFSGESTGLYEEEFYLPEEPGLKSLYDRSPASEDALCGYLSVEGIGYEDGSSISHPEAHFEEVHNQPIPLKDHTEGGNHKIQTINEPDEVSSLVSSHTPSSSIKSGGLVFDPVEDTLSNNLTRGPLLWFDEGHCLLWDTARLQEPINSGLDAVEADVARCLVGHWMPQRY